MACTIRCNRSDCDFIFQGECCYGGEAVNITEEGCRTYEPVDPDSYNNEQERLHDEMIDAQEREKDERYSDGL
jgi:hypothetical protein